MRGMKPLPNPDLVLHPAWRAIALGIVVLLFVSLGLCALLLVVAAGLQPGQALGAA